MRKDNKRSLRVYNKACKKLLFSFLNKLKKGQLTIHEGKDSYTFGNAEINNSAIAAVITINNPSAYKQFITGGSIGAAEAYIDKLWDCEDLTQLVQLFAVNQSLLDKLEKRFAFFSFMASRLAHLKNRNSESGSKKNILAHYDLGNDMYTEFLDESMMYSSAKFIDGTETLSQAQTIKLTKICDQLDLKETDHLIEIGTGWGGLAVFACQNYGCRVTTTTISDKQFQFAKERIERLGLSDKITLLKQDYRQLSGSYDKLVSVEMIEAVGHNYLATFFNKCNSLLKPQGKMLLQAITIADQRYDYYRKSVDFIQKYIFPGGCLPSIAIMANHIKSQSTMVIESIDDFGLDYAKTIEHWKVAFNKAQDNLHALGYDERFMRLWNYYLCYCQGGFKEKQISVVHLVANKIGH